MDDVQTITQERGRKRGDLGGRHHGRPWEELTSQTSRNQVFNVMRRGKESAFNVGELFL